LVEAVTKAMIRTADDAVVCS